MKKVCAQGSSTDECSSSASTEVKNKNVLIDTVLDDAEDLLLETDAGVPKSALQKYCRIFRCQFQELPDYFKQCSSHIKIKIDLVLIDLPYNACQELGR